MSDGKTGFMGEEVMKAVQADFEGEEIEEGRLKVLVEKKGKKMKKARLDKLKGVVESLGSLIKELEDDESIEKGGIVVSKKTDGANANGTQPSIEVNKEAIEKEANLKAALETVTKAQEAGGEALETEEVKKALELLAADKKEREEAADALLEKQKIAEAQAIVDKANKTDDKPLTAADLTSAVDAAVEKHVKPLNEKIEKMQSTPAEPSSEEPNSTEGDDAGSEEEVNKNLWSNVIY